MWLGTRAMRAKVAAMSDYRKLEISAEDKRTMRSRYLRADADQRSTGEWKRALAREFGYSTLPVTWFLNEVREEAAFVNSCPALADIPTGALSPIARVLVVVMTTLAIVIVVGVLKRIAG